MAGVAMRQATFFDELFTMDMGGATTKPEPDVQREARERRAAADRQQREADLAAQRERFEADRKAREKAKPDRFADFEEKIRQARARQQQAEAEEQGRRAEAKGFQNAHRAANAMWPMLGILRTSGREAIIAAYKKAAQFHHPDHKDTGSEERFKALGAEYSAAIQHARRMGFVG